MPAGIGLLYIQVQGRRSADFIPDFTTGTCLYSIPDNFALSGSYDHSFRYNIKRKGGQTFLDGNFIGIISNFFTFISASPKFNRSWILMVVTCNHSICYVGFTGLHNEICKRPKQ